MDEASAKRIKELEAERDAARSERDAAATEAAALKTKQALNGLVRDTDAATRLLTPDLLDKDGAPDTAKLLERYPFLAPDPATPTVPAATAPNGGGGPQNPTGGAGTLEDALKTGDMAAVNAAFDAELKAGGSK